MNDQKRAGEAQQEAENAGEKDGDIAETVRGGEKDGVQEANDEAARRENEPEGAIDEDGFDWNTGEYAGEQDTEVTPSELDPTKDVGGDTSPPAPGKPAKTDVREPGPPKTIKRLSDNYMSKDMKSADEWFGEFSKIGEKANNSRSIMDVFAKWVWDNVVAKDVIPHRMPSEVADALAELEQELSDISQTSDNLRWYFCRNPLDKWMTGQKLSREEFYLLSAQGIITIPSETGIQEAYEEFAYYLYEDDEGRGYINPSEYLDPPPVSTGNGSSTFKVHLTVGIVPEDVKTSFLRPDQLAFFRDFHPELFSRFKKD